MTNYHSTASDTVGERVRSVRRARNLTTAQLAARCAEMGAPEMTASVINDIERGRPADGVRRRLVAVEELLALALVLDVAPIHLIVPPDGDGELYPLTTTVTPPRRSVRDFIRGPYAQFVGPPVYPAETNLRLYMGEAPDSEFAAAQHERERRLR